MNTEEVDLQNIPVEDFREIEKKTKVGKRSPSKLFHIYQEYFYLQEQYLDDRLSRIIKDTQKKMATTRYFNKKLLQIWDIFIIL